MASQSTFTWTFNIPTDCVELKQQTEQDVMHNRLICSILVMTTGQFTYTPLRDYEPPWKRV